MKKINNQLVLAVFILILFAFNLKTTAQNFDNYTNIKSSGKIPSDFLILSSSKFEEAKNKISEDDEGFIKRSKKNFYLETNFLVDELLHNGKVLYNDPLGIYVNKVLAVLLENKPELKKQIRVYVVLSDIINAYATDNGIIFINVGLLAKLENEAQLAFVLGHEITHFEKNHVLNRYVMNETIQRKRLRINYSSSDVEATLFLKTTYEKKQEIEADLESTKLLLGTRYNPKAGMDVMHLFASAAPFREKHHFSPDFFIKDTSLKFSLVSIKFDALKYREDYEEDSKTHPALNLRSDLISELIDSSNNNKPYFILPESEFYTTKKIAQFEVSKIFLKKGNYTYALYCIYQLLQDYPNNSYLNDLLCKTFYLAAKSYSNEIDDRDYIEEEVAEDDTSNVSTVPKEIQYIDSYLSQFSGADLNTLSICFYLQTYPNEKIVANEIRLRDLLYDLKYKYDESIDASFKRISNGQAKIKAVPYVEQYLNSLSEKSEKSFALSENSLLTTTKKKTKKTGVKINSMIVLDPVYKKFDLRKKTQEQYIASEKALLAYNEQIRTISDQLEIKDTIVSPVGWTENDTIAFYNHSLFKGQVEEVLNNGSKIVSTDFELVKNTCNSSYQSSHLALMGTYSYHIQKDIFSKIVVLTWSAFLFPTLPLGIYYVVTPSYKTFTYLITINSKTQAVDFKHVRMLKFRDSKGAINSSMYYQLLKMKKGK